MGKEICYEVCYLMVVFKSRYTLVKFKYCQKREGQRGLLLILYWVLGN